MQHACPLPRYRPAQKSDSLGDGSAHSTVHGMAEPAVAAQGQHHQQYIGECRACAPPHTQLYASLLTTPLRPCSDGCDLGQQMCEVTID